jgi:hypothetical protein
MNVPSRPKSYRVVANPRMNLLGVDRPAIAYPRQSATLNLGGDIHRSHHLVRRVGAQNPSELEVLEGQLSWTVDDWRRRSFEDRVKVTPAQVGPVVAKRVVVWTIARDVGFDCVELWS